MTSNNNYNNNDPANKWRCAKDGTAVIQWDQWLAPYAQTLRARFARVQELKRMFEQSEGGLVKFAHSYERFGFNRGTGPNGEPGLWYRDWAPSARAVYLFGEFNKWNTQSHPLKRGNFGVWEAFLADSPSGEPQVKHGSKIKLWMQLASGAWDTRIPSWIRRVVQDGSPEFDGVYWNPPQKYEWKSPSPAAPSGLRIYEAHIGMSSDQPKVSSYNEFRANVLPYIASLGYNAIQLMAVMEHAYYSCFGYQVTNFFAVSSRYGTPEDLKALIDECHKLKIIVLLDIVHSHASSNVKDGISQYDGTDSHFFHGGNRGRHDIWDSRLFNYGNWETMRFLLSNVVWYLEEYHFDGFRFDGVLSMLYHHHGIGDQSYSYDHYYGGAVDADALAYLTLANEVIHTIKPDAVTIAEEVSGFPSLCRPVAEGGVGFDFRLQMACPDLWVHLLKKVKDDDWRMGDITWTLNNRRWMEKCISYAESHDQALVGDKTIAFWLMDKEMYDWMSLLKPLTPIIARGMALHKMIRLITMSLAGEGYLCFMGNEFGHGEWIDFPRPGNGNSYHHARRRWDLAKDPLLRYQQLLAFDKAMIALDEKYHFLNTPQAYITLTHEADKVIVFERGSLLFAFNFNPTQSFTGYGIPVRQPGRYRIVMDSDKLELGGHGRVDSNVCYSSYDCNANPFGHALPVYLPSRVALVWRLENQL